jgi:hypothetical protein
MRNVLGATELIDFQQASGSFLENGSLREERSLRSRVDENMECLFGGRGKHNCFLVGNRLSRVK